MYNFKRFLVPKFLVFIRLLDIDVLLFNFYSFTYVFKV